MSSFIKDNTVVAVLLGAGFATFSVGGLIIYYKITKNNNELKALRGKVDKLQSKIELLNASLDNLNRAVGDLSTTISETGRQSKPRRSRSWYSVHASSGDEEDIYEEALAGSDNEVSFHDIEHNDTPNDETVGDVPPTPSDTEELYTNVDRLLSGTDQDKEEAYNILNTKKDMLSSDVDFMWRLAKAAYNVSQVMGGRGDTEKQKELVFAAKDLSYAALDIQDDVAEVHKWCAITLGSWSEYGGMQQKIKSGYTFREHIDKAIELNKEDSSLHHLLGRWSYGVYMLTWIERNVAATLFATPPTSTAGEALANFLEAERLEPDTWKENMLYIAKCYIELRDYGNAGKWLKKANVLPIISPDDKSAQAEIETLLPKYS